MKHDAHLQQKLIKQSIWYDVMRQRKCLTWSGCTNLFPSFNIWIKSFTLYLILTNHSMYKNELYSRYENNCLLQPSVSKDWKLTVTTAIRYKLQVWTSSLLTSHLTHCDINKNMWMFSAASVLPLTFYLLCSVCCRRRGSRRAEMPTPSVSAVWTST